LQLCRSALVTHPLEWQEIHTHLMRLAGPDVNYIEASENFQNLESAMEYYRAHDDEAEQIARNSYETFARRYLTPAAVSTTPAIGHRRCFNNPAGNMLLEAPFPILGIRTRIRAAVVRNR
jgi:hypothetical protein